MLKTLLILGASFTSLIALLNAVFILKSPTGSTLWDVSRVLVSLFILGVGVLTWNATFSKKPEFKSWQLLLICSLGLMLLGIAGTFMAIYSGKTTGDFEYYLFPIHALLFGQGALSFRYLRQVGQNISTV